MENNLLDLSGKNVVITGGNRGLGLSIVQLANSLNGNVGYTYRSRETVPADQAPDMGNATPFYFELGKDEPQFLEAVRRWTAPSGIDVFIANAGMEFSGDLSKHEPEIMQEVVMTNLVGNMRLARELILGGYMSPGGQIAFVGSIASAGNHDQFAYSAAKAGLEGAVGSLFYDGKVREQGLGIKVIEPAFVRTPMTDKILKILERRVIKAKGGDELVEEFRNSGYVMTPEYAASEVLKRAGDPGVVGVSTIPENADLRAMRAKYIDKD